MTTLRTSLLSLLLLTAVFFSAWLIHALQNNSSENISNTNNPDAFMTEATNFRMDENGYLHSQIYTNKMVHYALNDISDLQAPRIMLFNDKHQPWIITADFGQSQFGSSQVHLWQDVLIHEPSLFQGQTTMTTTTLMIYPGPQIASTNAPVTISQPGTVVKSVGLRADLKKGEVKLLSQSQGIYDTAMQDEAPVQPTK